ncbi:hypothetical protein BGZ65_002278, partial [Modicella reniformis]
NGLRAFLDTLARKQKSQGDLLRQGTNRGQNDDVHVDVYGSVRFFGLDCGKRAIYSTVSFAQPYQGNRVTKAKRVEFWEQSQKRLMQGSLVFFVRCNIVGPSSAQDWPAAQVVPGIVAYRNINSLAKDGRYSRIHISLTDPKSYVTILNATSSYQSKGSHEQWYLVEPSGGFFESYRSALGALQNRLPTAFPFGKYLAPTEEETETMLATGVRVDPPMYARSPNFRFDLSILLKGRGFKLDVTNPVSIAKGIKVLQESKVLDITQSKALVEALSREVALVNGPPGTGKTRTGVELMRVLLHNKQAMDNRPILCICYTNHALDQFLEHLLDKEITNIIRVGSRSKSERLGLCNLRVRQKTTRKSFQMRKANRESNQKWKFLSGAIKELQTALRSDVLSWKNMEPYLANGPDQWKQFNQPRLPSGSSSDEYKDDGFTRFRQWLVDIDGGEWRGEDLEPHTHETRGTDRPLELLNGDVWEMSSPERKTLSDSWKPVVREFMMNNLAELLEEAKKTIDAKDTLFDEIRQKTLCQASVIGMTTSGAAKHQALISAVAPKIIICEEAGEVVESHILAALSDSTQHLILIGDHLQLRPQIQTYNLSSDSAVGRHHNLDISLFERLVTAKKNPLPMSQLTIQRRMRPEISSLIRNTLYPGLEDGENVNYPHVNGMNTDLYFMDHAHPQDSKDEFGVQSFANTFEVKMVEALVHYLIMNGYNCPGDIAVLTPYLGQLSKLRRCLSDSFMLVMNEQDQEQLDMHDARNESETASSVSKNISLQSQITLQTIDNYQGEEAKIVIISLVRSDVHDDGTVTSFASIGFLKSPNRTNVLLSRAQHGMYLIGNANLMEKAKHGIWPQIVRELRESDRVGEGFPIVCKNHPDIVNVVNTPEMFKKIAPNGGCDRPCGYNMSCGHICPLMCKLEEPGLPSAILGTKNTSMSSVLSDAYAFIHTAIMSVLKHVQKNVETVWRFLSRLLSPDVTKSRIRQSFNAWSRSLRTCH